MSELSPMTKAEVAASIYDSRLLKFGKYVLKSGVTSPFYVDLRQAQSHPETFATIVDAYSEVLEDTDSSVFLAGVPEAGTPFAAAVGYSQHRSLVQPRKVIKEHGTKASVEGVFKQGDRVVLLDDLITKGDSKLEAIKQVEDAGLVIEKFIVLIDREQGGMEMVRDAGYDIEAAFSISALVANLRDQEKITQHQHDTVLNFINAP